MNLIEKEKIKDLKKYFGKVDLDIDLAALRKRWKVSKYIKFGRFQYVTRR